MGLSGFNLRNVISSVASDLLYKIVQRGDIDLYRYLWSHKDFIDIWTPEDLLKITQLIISDESLTAQLLEFHLTGG